MVEFGENQPPPNNNEGSQIGLSDILRSPQIPVEFPNGIRTTRLWQQLPPGQIAYLDTRLDPHTVHFLDQEGHPVMVHGVEKTEDIRKKEKAKNPAVVIHTPPRTPENSFGEYLDPVVERLTRKTTRDHLKRIIEQSMGVLVIVEDVGDDVRIGWREDQLRSLGLVVDKERGERIVFQSGNKLVTMGRIVKKRGPVDLRSGEKSRFMVDPMITHTKERLEGNANTVDTSGISREADASDMPPRTFENLRDGNNIKITSPEGCVLEIDRKGIQTPHHVCENPQEHRFEAIKPVEVPKKQLPMPGQTIISDDLCGKGGCEHHLEEKYYSEYGHTRNLLFKDVLCPSHGLKDRENGHKYVRPLEFLPPNLRTTLQPQSSQARHK